MLSRLDTELESWWNAQKLLQDLMSEPVALASSLAQPGEKPVVFVLLTLAIVSTVAVTLLSIPDPNYRQGLEPYIRGEYDPVAAAAYYRRHPIPVLQRVLQIWRLSNRFVTLLLLDKYIFRKEEENRGQRAKELLELVTQLGPTAIKVGQALSVRPDLIPEEYAAALGSLQDRVPPFDDRDAQRVLVEQLGTQRVNDLGQIQLVASASIGQVYQSRSTGAAVKVQRPNVLAEIALDLYLVREFGAPIYAAVTSTATDLTALANEWGRGFIAELDYRTEAEKTSQFQKAMKARNLLAVTSPTVVQATEQVLITEWVEGVRIDQSDAQDIPRLCAVALNAYLVMLLELQSLHTDPHPGNLLRTTDGRLCILDFGMTLDIDPQLQYSLLEFVAHLTAESYDDLPDDLVRLGFLKADKLEFAKRSGTLEPLKYFLRQAGKGGGASGVRDRIFDEYREKYPGLSDDDLRVEMRAEMKQQMKDIVERESVATGITVEVEELQRRNRDSFMIPEWFLYTSRAFLTLEGLSLQADPNYSIIKSCFPYVAKRLVADQDPRAIKALKDLLYGASDKVDADRLVELAEGFSSFSTTTKRVNEEVPVSIVDDGAGSSEQTETVIDLAKDSAEIILSSDGNLLQSLLLEEGALATSAGTKDFVKAALLETPERVRSTLPFGDLLPKLPFEEQVQPFLEKSATEERAQLLAEKLLEAIQTSDGRSLSPSSGSALETLRSLDAEQAALVLRELRQNLPKYVPLVQQLGTKFASRLFKTTTQGIEETLSRDELNLDPVTRASAQSLSSAAQRSASFLDRQASTSAK